MQQIKIKPKIIELHKNDENIYIYEIVCVSYTNSEIFQKKMKTRHET